PPPTVPSSGASTSSDQSVVGSAQCQLKRSAEERKRGSVRFALGRGPHQRPAGGLDVGRAHQRLADQDRVDADALEVLELLARMEARLGYDGLAGRDVREQLE